MRQGVRSNAARWVRRALASGVDPNGVHRRKDGESGRWLEHALLHPASVDVVPVVRVLLDHGASVHEPSVRHTPVLWWATYKQHWAAARLLVERGASLMVDQASPHHPWLCAVEAGQVDLVRAMLDRGFDPNAMPYKGQTAMLRLGWTATVEGRRAMDASTKLALLDLLHSRGAQVNAQDPTTGRVPVALVVRSGPNTFEAEVFEWFVRHGADLTVRVPHPLHRFHQTLRPRGQGAKADHYDENGWSLLHMAARTGHTALVQRLIALGVDPAWRTSAGRTALDVARHHDHHSTTTVLEQQDLRGVLGTAGPAPGLSGEVGSFTTPGRRARL